MLTAVELELQGLADDRRAADADQLHDLLRRVGELRLDEIAARSAPGAPVQQWVDALVTQRRAILVRIGGDDRVAAAEDAARLRDGLGVSIPIGLPGSFTEPLSEADALGFLVGRFARTHGPFFADDVVVRLNAPPDRIAAALAALEESGRIVRGEFRPGGQHVEWCDGEVLRRIKNRSLAVLRREVEPVEGPALARFLHALARHRQRPPRASTRWWRCSSSCRARRSRPRCSSTTCCRAGSPATGPPTSTSCALPAAVVWVGAGALGPTATGTGDGRVVLCFRDRLRLLAPEPASGDARPDGPLHDAIREHLAQRGASFWLDLVGATRRRRRRVAPGRALGPRVGRRGHQRHVGTAAGTAVARRCGPRPRAGPGWVG